MKKSKAKYATLAGVVLSAGILLSACGNSSTGSKHIIMSMLVIHLVLII